METWLTKGPMRGFGWLVPKALPRQFLKGSCFSKPEIKSCQGLEMTMCCRIPKNLQPRLLVCLVPNLLISLFWKSRVCCFTNVLIVAIMLWLHDHNVQDALVPAPYSQFYQHRKKQVVKRLLFLDSDFVSSWLLAWPQDKRFSFSRPWTLHIA